MLWFSVVLLVALVVGLLYFAWEHSRSAHGRMRGLRGDQWRRGDVAGE